MSRVVGVLFIVSVMGFACGVVYAGVDYPDPAGGWAYVYDGTAVSPSSTSALDGTWNHDNGSDQWDGSLISNGRPGGVAVINESLELAYLRLQDPGNPRDYGMGDPGSNRKIYFAHDLTADGAPDNLVDAVTLSFRARIPTTGPLDDLHPDGGGGIAPYPMGGDGYVIHNDGKGHFGIGDVDDRLISFALTTGPADHETVSLPGLVMNNLNGTTPGDVDMGEAGTLNLLLLDPTQWHEFWITIQSDTTGTGTHLVTVSLDGSLAQDQFIVTAGRGDNPYPGINFIQLGMGATGQSGALDVDFFAYAPGVIPVPEPTTMALLGLGGLALLGVRRKR